MFKVIIGIWVTLSIAVVLYLQGVTLEIGVNIVSGIVVALIIIAFIVFFIKNKTNDEQNGHENPNKTQLGKDIDGR